MPKLAYEEIDVLLESGYASEKRYLDSASHMIGELPFGSNDVRCGL